MRINKLPRKRDWHRWFAWFPVSISEGEMAWLEYVERRGELISDFFECYWRWEYRTRADALEEAAKVAAECHFDEDDPRSDDRDRAYAQARRHAAKDIRKLKDKEQ